MFRNTLLATTALVVATSGAYAATHKPTHQQKQTIKLAPGMTIFTRANHLQGMVALGNGKQGVNHGVAIGDLGKNAKAKFNVFNGWSIELVSYFSTYFSSLAYQAIAEPIVGDGNIHKSIQVALDYGETNYGYGNVDFVSLNSDSGGIPGSVIHSGTATATELTSTFQNDCCVLKTVKMPATTLTSGTHYWIVVEPNAGNTYNGWAWESSDFTLADVGSGSETIDYDSFGFFCTYYGSSPYCSSHNTGWVAYGTQGGGVAGQVK